MVFQNYALYPHMNAADNMGFALKMRGVPKARDRRGACARRRGSSGSTDALKKKPRTLSGGQRQRVAMGRAIVRQPQAFLMDEPLSNLDAKLRVEMRAEIARIQRDLSVTTVYVTHDQTEAMTMGDRVAVMRNGSSSRSTAQVLYERPRNLFVAEFIGSPAMNLVAGGPRARRRRDLGHLRRPPPAAGAGDRRDAPGALRLRRARRSSSASGRRTWRTPLSCRRRPTTGRSPSSATSARTWAPRCTSHFNVDAEPVSVEGSRRGARRRLARGRRGADRRRARARGRRVVRRTPRAHDRRA